MSKTRNIVLFFTALILLGLSGCKTKQATVSEGGFYHSGIYFGKHIPPVYQKGIKDGCTTSKGKYKKSHELFNNEHDYHEGWFLGRNRCKDLLESDDDKVWE